METGQKLTVFLVFVDLRKLHWESKWACFYSAACKITWANIIQVDIMYQTSSASLQRDCSMLSMQLTSIRGQ